MEEFYHGISWVEANDDFFDIFGWNAVRVTMALESTDLDEFFEADFALVAHFS